jgi:hypothetical protein
MDTEPAGIDRRQALALLAAGSLAALAGCGDTSGEATTTDETDDEGAPDAVLRDEVPDEYVTAASVNGMQRDPDALAGKDQVSYQTDPRDGEQCSGCAYYISDRNGDDIGACALVEGNISPDAWCTSYVAKASDDS